MRLSPTIIGTLFGVLGTCLLMPALSGADDVTVLCWALGPVIVGFVIGLLVDLGREPSPPPREDPPKSDAPAP
jgi:uncharacterized membrane protein